MTVNIHRDHSELSDAEFAKLKESCLNARDLSYSPYSKFRVGCTLITSDDIYISGANVENASYGACICAERTAITKSVPLSCSFCQKFHFYFVKTSPLQIEGHRSLKALAISSDSDEPISPCGICRQFIREFGERTPIFMFDKTGTTYIKVYLDDLLPLSFGPENLGINPSEL